MNSLVLLWGLVLGFPSASLALDPAKAPHQYLHNTWQIDDGLPQNSVMSIAQSRDGYLWFGTQEGLVRYDGIDFEVFDKHSAPTLRHSQIDAIVSVHDVVDGSPGEVWIGGRGGLFKYRAGVFERILGESNDGVVVVKDMAADGQGGVWAATDRGLFHVGSGAPQRYGNQHGLGRESLSDVAVGASGDVFCAGASGLVVFGGERFSSIASPKEVQRGSVLDIVGSNSHIGGEVLVAVENGGVWKIGAGSLGYPIDEFSELAGRSINTMLASSSGALWLGEREGGLGRYFSGELRMIDTGGRLPKGTVESLAEDREGNLWVGMSSLGLHRIWDGRFGSVTTKDGLPDEMVWAVFEDQRKQRWVGTSKGVAVFADGEVTLSLSQADGLAEDSVNCFASQMINGRERVWIGTEGGISAVEDGEVVLNLLTRGDDNSRGGHDVRALLAHSTGNLWAGDNPNGVTIFEAGKISRRLSSKDGLSGDVINTLFEDKNGRVWVGTSTGMSLVSGELVQSFGKAQGFTDHEVMSFFEDGDELWIGTDHGIYHYAGERFTRLSVEQGIFDDKAFTIIDDGKGWLWLSSNKGVYRLSKGQLKAVVTGHRKTVDSVSYGAADGMRARECNFAGPNAAWQMSDGELWFSTIDGVAVINPSREGAMLEPVVVIESVEVDGVARALYETAILEPGVEDIEIHYSAPSFGTAGRMRYSYRLRGHEEHWSHVGSRRLAHFASLPPGKYEFEVVAENRDGLSSVRGASFEFVLRPRFVQTVLFYFLCAVVVFLLGLVLGLWRIRAMRQRQRELARLVGERTAQLADANRQLRDLSLRDPLTGLRNRRYLPECVDAELAEIQRLGYGGKAGGTSEDLDIVMMMVDLDHFKSVNDTWGHDAGDAVLKQVAEILLKVARVSDTMIRWGGEEFLVVAKKSDRNFAHLMAERLRQEIEGFEFDIGNDEPLRLTCSIGFACYPFATDTPLETADDSEHQRPLPWDTVLVLADQALYAAKYSSRNAWVGLFAGPTAMRPNADHRIRHEPAKMLESGELRAATSLPEINKLTWDE